jgi:hypothetical protein
MHVYAVDVTIHTESREAPIPGRPLIWWRALHCDPGLEGQCEVHVDGYSALITPFSPHFAKPIAKCYTALLRRPMMRAGQRTEGRALMVCQLIETHPFAEFLRQ